MPGRQVVDINDVLHDGTPRRDEEIIVKGRLLLVNTVPIRSNGKIIGAISTFRDKTEVSPTDATAGRNGELRGRAP
ncbi:two-component sensor kinase [Salmonella bongori]|nr:two-component sensor kinase [Salmonella bongori]